MVLLGAMAAGGTTVDVITGTMLPITARHFTADIGLIGIMVALNRIFGFVAQPYAAWKSDRHRSAAGRRRPFLMFGWGATLLSVATLGALPFLFPAAMHHTFVAVAVFFMVNLAMQACLDVAFGCTEPLYGDTFTGGDLGRASAFRGIAANGASIFMTAIAIPLADRNEYWPYLGAVGFLALSLVVTACAIREEPVAKALPPERYNPFRPLAELRDPKIASVAMVASATLVTLGLTEMLHSLFVIETLGLSKTVLGWTVSVGIVASLLLSYPIGLLVDRFGPGRVLVVGFVFVGMVELAFVTMVQSALTLCLVTVLWRVGWNLINIPITPLIFQHATPERRGSVFAGVQTTRAVVTSLATLGAGFLADRFDSYRVCYLIAAAMCVPGLWGAWRLITQSGTPSGNETRRVQTTALPSVGVES